MKTNRLNQSSPHGARLSEIDLRTAVNKDPYGSISQHASTRSSSLISLAGFWQCAMPDEDESGTSPHQRNRLKIMSLKHELLRVAPHIGVLRKLIYHTRNNLQELVREKMRMQLQRTSNSVFAQSAPGHNSTMWPPFLTMHPSPEPCWSFLLILPGETA